MINKRLDPCKRVVQNDHMKKGQKNGYARVSTREQNLDLQMDALTGAGCDQIFTDQGISSTAVERDGLPKALEAAQEGDTLVVWKLDRLMHNAHALKLEARESMRKVMGQLTEGEHLQ